MSSSSDVDVMAHLLVAWSKIAHVPAPTEPVPADAVGAVTVRYWAAARAAAGRDSDAAQPGTLAQVLDEVRAAHAGNERFARVLEVCSVLIGERPVGARGHDCVDVPAGAVVELLPPFAGGC